MKGYRYFFTLIIIASFGFSVEAFGDTLELMGPSASNWDIGWTKGAEAWGGTAWCGDTLSKDSSGTATVLDCDALISELFLPDTGGLYPDSAHITYINYTYKFRNYYAQLPIVWNGWGGTDLTGYKYFMTVYKGLLSVHQMRVSFFYSYNDSIKNTEKLGDGVGLLAASPNQWKTAVLQIPDSVDMAGITGVTFAVENAPGKGGKTSDAGNIKVARVAFISGNTKAMRHADPGIAKSNRFSFTPSSGSLAFSAYSLKGEALASKVVSVQSGRKYSVRRFVRDQCGAIAAQVRLITIKGEGVRVAARVW